MSPNPSSDAAPAGNAAAQDGSLADQAYRKLYAMILERRLGGGELLVEGRLAATLGLTRTPLREAMVRLEGAGLLVKHRNRSFVVRQVGVAEYLQTLRVRQFLECKAATLAVARMGDREIRALRQRIVALERANRRLPAHWSLDDDLHNGLAAASGNAVLADTIRRLRMTTQLFEVSRPFERASADAAEHLAILDALERRDAPAAEQAVLEHLRNIEQDVLAIVSGG